MLDSRIKQRYLIFSTYSNLDASFRLRILPVVDHLIASNFEVKVYSIFSDFTYRNRNRTIIHKLLVSIMVVFKLVRRIISLFEITDQDIVIIHREFFPFFLPWFERRVASRAKYSILDFDDALYTSPSAGRDWRFFLRNPERFSDFVSQVDRVIVSSPTLMDWAKSFNSNVHIRYTFPPRMHPVDNLGIRTDILWIGSDSSFVHLKPKIELLNRIAQEHDLVINVLGGDRMMQYRWPKRFNVKLWSMSDEVRFLASRFVGIMPLNDDEWSRGKGAFKLFQYMSVGMPVVASPFGMNSNVIQESKCGYAVLSEEEWERSFRKLLYDPILFEQLGSNGYTWLIEQSRIMSLDIFKNLDNRPRS